MHQDEHNQPEEPVTVAAPLENDQPETASAPEPAVASADPALASATVSSEPSFAQTPAEPVTPEPSIDETPDPKPEWMTRSEPTPPETAVESENVILPPPLSPEPALYVSPSWASSDTQDEDEPSDSPDGSDRADFVAPPETAAETAPWQPSSVAEGAEAYAGDAPPPPVWVTAPISDAPTDESATAESPAYERPAEPHVAVPHGGPNWMLAFVCGWAAFTSFMEAPVAYAAKETMINGSTVTLTANDRLYGGLGFGLLGLGLLLFGIEALLWGRRRRGVSGLLTIGLPVLVSLAGVVFLILSHYPGSRI